MTEPGLDCGAVTDTGLVPDYNEDRYWADAERGAFLVVDGVGGQAAGERAAEIGVAAIWESIEADRPPKATVCPTVRVREAIAAADNRILVDAANRAGGRDNITAVFVAGPAFGVRRAATRPGIAGIRARRGLWSGRAAFLSCGLLPGMLLWAVLRIRG